MESSVDSGAWGNVQNLGFCGVIKQSQSVLCSRKKLFLAIASTLTLPLCFITLAHGFALDPLISRIQSYEDESDSGDVDTNTDRSLHNRIRADRIRLGVLLAVYVLLVLVFSLLSTAATVYSVACIYTKHPLTYRKVFSVLPRVWRRLFVTFVWAFVVVFFLVGAFLAIVLFVLLVFYRLKFIVAEVLWWLASIVFAMLLFHFTCVFCIANVVSVLEESYGFRALIKSHRLLKGKRVVSYTLYALYLLFSAVIVIGFDGSMFNLDSIALEVLITIVFSVFLAIVNQFSIVIFTILYFVYKAFHHESIDMLALSDHLGAYGRQYVNLRASVQMEEMQSA